MPSHTKSERRKNARSTKKSTKKKSTRPMGIKKKKKSR